MFGLEGGGCVVVEQTKDSVWFEIAQVYLSFANVIKWYGIHRGANTDFLGCFLAYNLDLSFIVYN